MFQKSSCEAWFQHSLSNENKTFCSSWNSIFELGNFFFNSYVYYLSCGFIASTRAFSLPTRAFNLATRAFSVLTRRFELVTRGLKPVTLGFELVTRGFEFVTRKSCFTFPGFNPDPWMQVQDVIFTWKFQKLDYPPSYFNGSSAKETSEQRILEILFDFRIYCKEHCKSLLKK